MLPRQANPPKRDNQQESHKRRLLITGASGFLGWNACSLLSRTWHVFGVASTHPVTIPDVVILRADLTSIREIKKLFLEARPDAVLHAAAMASPNVCQAKAAESRRINVDAAIEIAGMCADMSIPLAFTSTDLVFNGLRAPYSEEDPVSPVNIYGEHKAMAEEGILRRYPKAAVCRMPLMFGDPSPYGASFIQPMIQAIRDGSEIKLFTDELRTPVSARGGVKGLVLALDLVEGIIHLGGPQRVSRYEIGKLLTDVLGYPHAKLTPCRSRDVPMPAPRSLDVSLDSSKAFALGYAPGAVLEELKALEACNELV